MSDAIENAIVTAEEEPQNPASMAGTDQQQAQPVKPGHVSFSIWPPTQRTRDAVTARLIETLTTPSILSKRYGTMPPEEAAEEAKRIEAEAYVAAGGSHAEDDDGMEVLRVYSKEVSKRMIDAVKNRSDGNGAPPSPAVMGSVEESES